MISSNVVLGPDVVIFQRDQVNLYGCTIGGGTRIGPFVEIQRNAFIGENCKVSSHSFICEGVTIEDECFIGHHVVFTNDRYPRAVSADGTPQTAADWQVVPTQVGRRASTSDVPSAGDAVKAGSIKRNEGILSLVSLMCSSV